MLSRNLTAQYNTSHTRHRRYTAPHLKYPYNGGKGRNPPHRRLMCARVLIVVSVIVGVTTRQLPLQGDSDFGKSATSGVGTRIGNNGGKLGVTVWTRKKGGEQIKKIDEGNLKN